MEHHQDGFPPPVDLTDQLQNLKLPPDIQIGGRLVQKNQFCILRKNHGKKRLLPFSSGQGMQFLFAFVSHPGHLQRFFHLFQVCPARSSAEPQIREPAVQHQAFYGNRRYTLALRRDSPRSCQLLWRVRANRSAFQIYFSLPGHQLPCCSL